MAVIKAKEGKIALWGRVRVRKRLKSDLPPDQGDWTIAKDWGPNCILYVGLHMIAYWAINDAAKYQTGFLYQCIGTDGTDPANDDEGLGAEVARKTFTTKSYSESTRVISLSTFFAASECDDDIQEVGVAGTSDATATLDTGVYINRFQVDFDNSSGEYDLTVDTEIGLQEGSAPS